MSRVVLERQTSKERVMRVDPTSTSRAVDIELAHVDLSSRSTSDDELGSYERNLQGLKRIALVTDITTVCNWCLAFCALTWASAVLLGAYVSNLSEWQYYEVSVLLLVEGLRFGVAGLLRTVGIYKLGPWIRWFLRSAGIFIPLWMGGFALLSILPTHIKDNIGDRFLLRSSLVEAPQSAPANSYFSAPPPQPASYNSLSASLTIFYSFILANAFVLLLGRFIAALVYLLYVKNRNYRSIHKYHDKLLIDSGGWIEAVGIDFDYAFKMQSFEYKRRQTAIQVCQDYADLIRCLYTHEKGMEAVEAALGVEDVYVREAAANIVGFFAVLEKDPSSKARSVPLCYQVGMLAKLKELVGGGYGTTSMAAARSFALLMQVHSVESELMVSKLARLHESTVGGILQERYDEVQGSIKSGRTSLREKSRWHLHARGKLLCIERGGAGVEGAQCKPQLQANEEGGGAEGADEMIIREHDLLSAREREYMDAYYEQIQKAFEDAEAREGFWKHCFKIGIFLLVNVALPLVLGFAVKAYLLH